MNTAMRGLKNKLFAWVQSVITPGPFQPANHARGSRKCVCDALVIRGGRNKFHGDLVYTSTS